MRNVSNYCYVCFLLKTCERYIKNEECFWQCEPNLIKWHVKEGALEGVPICAKYCDDWFDACKDDFTCAEDWLSDFNYSSNVYSCPTASKCLKFSKVTSSSSSYTLIKRGKLEYTMCLFWNISSDALSHLEILSTAEEGPNPTRLVPPFGTFHTLCIHFDGFWEKRSTVIMNV